jgi:beta-lactamase regulating signal transducer with metallopeptidase domain
MRTIESFVSLFVHLNLVLICAFLFFTTLRRLLQLFRILAPHQVLVRCSQALILISILVPTALHLIPEKELPRINLRAFNSIPEELGRPVFFQRPLTKEKINVPAIRPVPEHSAFAFHFNTFFLLWMLGFLIVCLRMLAAFFKLNQILDRSIPFHSIGQVQLRVAETISVPFSARFYRKKWVVLPISILSRQRDLQLALKHELQHHRQGDTLWAVGIEILVCLFYINPVIYLWKNLVIELQEFSCDEALIGQNSVSAHEYGSCLVRVAETALANREMQVGTTCMAAMGKNPIVLKSLLQRRIEMMMQDRKSARVLAGSFIGTITVLFTIAVAYGTEQSARNAVNAGIAPVDAAIQKIADQVLANAMKDEKAEAGIAIVADPNTGTILAIANLDLKNNRKGHWGLSEQLEPASFMKAITAAQAIEQGVTTPTEEHNCENGVYQYGDRTLHDWKKGGWEKLTTSETVAKSSDICTMKIAEEIGPAQIQPMLISYGFGPNGSAKLFPEAKSGQLPADDSSKYSSLVPAAAYGMGFTSTPLEVLQAIGAIANGGNLLLPKEVGDANPQPQTVRRVLSEENSRKARDILRQVVLTGTAQNYSSKLYSMAGKTESTFTGGVLEGDSTGGTNKTNVAGFVGFAPATHPRIAVFVQIFHPGNPADPTGAHGSSHAVPVFTALIDRVLQSMNVAPDKTTL